MLGRLLGDNISQISTRQCIYIIQIIAGMDDRNERRETKPSKKIYISNLSMDADQANLRKSFEQYGTIVDINLKSKENGIVFAFIQFDSIQNAEKAIDAMNKKTLMEKELKVEFARGRERDRNDRGGYRGGDRGDRGDRGYRGGRDFQRRGPRDGGDRPRGCFNCGQQGHFAKQCPKPRKPRQFNNNRNDREGGGYRGSSNSYKGGSDRRGGDRGSRKKSESNSRSNSRSRSNDRKKKSRRSSSSSRSR